MSNLDVSVTLRLINQMRGTAAAAELNRVKTAAKSLDGAHGGRLTAELNRAAAAGGRVSTTLRTAGAASATVGRELDRAAAAGGRLTSNVSGAQSAIRGASSAAKGLASDLDRAAAAAGRVSRRARDVRAHPSVKALAGDGPATDRGSTMLLGGRGLGGLGGLAGIYGAKRAIDATVGSAITFDKAMAEVKKKVDLPPGEGWENLERTITRNAIAFGRSRAEIAGLVAEAAAAGTSYGDLADYTALASKASVAWDMSARDTSQRLAEIRAATGWSVRELTDFVDKVNHMGDTSAAKERDVVEMFQRSGAAAKAAGVSFDASLASLTALRSIGMGEEVSSRFFNAFTSKLRTAGSSKKEAKEAYKTLGLDPKEVEKGMKTNAFATMVDLLERLKKAKDQAAVARSIFGGEWWDEAARMVDAIPEMVKNMEALKSGAWRGSSSKSLDHELATTANHLERFKALTETIGEGLGKWALPPINEALDNAIKKFERLDNSANAWQRRSAENDAAEAERRRLRGEPDAKDGKKSAIEDLTPGRNPAEEFDNWLFGRKGQAGTQLAEAREAGRDKAQEEALDRYARTRRALAAARARLGLVEPGKGRQAEMETSRLRGVVASLEASELSQRPGVDSVHRDRSRRLADIEAQRRGGTFGLTGPVPTSGTTAPAVPSRSGGPAGPGAFSLSLDVSQPLSEVQKLKLGLTQDLSGAAAQSMAGYTAAISAGVAAAVAVATTGGAAIKAALSFTATPTIAPKLSAPAAPAGGGGGGAAGKGASLRGGSTGATIQTAHFHGIRDVSGFQRQVARLTDRAARDERDGALHDIG